MPQTTTAPETAQADDVRKLSDKLMALDKAATPGPWAVESEKSDGSYGSGEDTFEGYDTAVIVTEAETRHGKPGVLFESHNSTVGSICEESDDESFRAWDEVSEANAAFIVALVNAYRGGQLTHASWAEHYMRLATELGAALRAIATPTGAGTETREAGDWCPKPGLYDRGLCCGVDPCVHAALAPATPAPAVDGIQGPVGSDFTLAQATPAPAVDGIESLFQVSIDRYPKITGALATSTPAGAAGDTVGEAEHKERLAEALYLFDRNKRSRFDTISWTDCLGSTRAKFRDMIEGIWPAVLAARTTPNGARTETREAVKRALNIWHQSSCYPKASDGELGIGADAVFTALAAATPARAVDGVEAMRLACLRIVEHPNAGLVPPDGGDPTPAEMLANIAADIRALATRPASQAPAASAGGEALQELAADFERSGATLFHPEQYPPGYEQGWKEAHSYCAKDLRAALAPAAQVNPGREEIARIINAKWDALLGPANDHGTIGGIPGAWRRSELCDQFADAIIAARPVAEGGVEKRSSDPVPSALHTYVPHEKYPHCAVCGYARSERLMHADPSPAGQEGGL